MNKERVLTFKCISVGCKRKCMLSTTDEESFVDKGCFPVDCVYRLEPVLYTPNWVLVGGEL